MINDRAGEKSSIRACRHEVIAIKSHPCRLMINSGNTVLQKLASAMFHFCLPSVLSPSDMVDEQNLALMYGGKGLASFHP